ncbi:hypothetical protein ACWEFL_02760 [Streptomyces sp. NPDC004838]
MPTDPRAHAQTRALEWAAQADNHQHLADQADDRARELSAKPFVTKELERHRESRALHTDQADRAVRLAEMWARVATAF